MRAAKNIPIVALAVLMLIAWPAGRADAGAWTQEQGQCYAKVWARMLIGSGAFDHEGDVQDEVADYVDIAAQLYAECGLHPRLTAIVFGAPFGYASVEGSSTPYVGPLGVGLRFDPIGSSGPTRFALQAAYSFAPTVGEEVLFVEPSIDHPVYYQPALQNHAGELQLLFGHGFSFGDKVSGWFTAGAGIRVNSAANVTTALVASLQLGFTFYGRFQLEVHVPVYEPFGRTLTETNIAGVGQTRYVGFGAGASFWFVDSFAVTAAVEGAAIAASNAATPSIVFGFESRFRVWNPE